LDDLDLEIDLFWSGRGVDEREALACFIDAILEEEESRGFRKLLRESDQETISLLDRQKNMIGEKGVNSYPVNQGGLNDGGQDRDSEQGPPSVVHGQPSSDGVSYDLAAGDLKKKE
jgi:hypothetical protein